MRKLACMLVYLMAIQIYDQVSILRSWSKAKLHCVVLLGFILKESKITLNIMKVGVHSYLPNWSRVKLRHAVSLRLGLKGVKIAKKNMKFGVHGYLSNGHPNL